MLHRPRYNYWCSSNLADIIRGSKKPYALGWKEWDVWHKEAKEKNPIRYWIAETGLKKLQDLFMFPMDVYHTISIYIQNRWIDQTHVLKTGLKPGEYYEFDYKVLHGLFNELSDYVEVELAASSKYANPKKYNFIRGRCRQAGIDHLDWASGLVYDEDFGTDKNDPLYGELTPQAISAQKVKNLYLWWKDIRPNRPDPHEVYNYKSFEADEFVSTISKEHRKALTDIAKTEKKYDKEDTDKLIELIKIRREIWT